MGQRYDGLPTLPPGDLQHENFMHIVVGREPLGIAGVMSGDVVPMLMRPLPGQIKIKSGASRAPWFPYKR